ncbi:MAG: hypothetical protein ACE37K_22505 [Planctomycetota bacterium]
MPVRNRIVTIVGAIVVVGVVLLLLDGARPGDRWLVLGAERTLAGEGTGTRFDAGLGLIAGPSSSNAFVESPTPTDLSAGFYWSERTFYDDDGHLAREAVQFPHGNWHEVQTDVLERDVPTLLGGTAVHYQVRVAGAVTDDGGHWLFRPEVRGQGRAGYSIRADVRFHDLTRELEVLVQESFDGGTVDRYTFWFVLGDRGTLTARD